jgi:hypothetical protein
MLSQGNKEATEYLRSIKPEKADTIRWKLVESLGNHRFQFLSFFFFFLFL